MTNDPVVHDQGLNESFRQDIPRKPEPELDDVKISWLTIVPKFTDILGVQLTAENIENIARLMHWEYKPAYRGLRDSVLVPSITGDVPAMVNDWILVADNNWDVVTVCTAAAFNRSYEVKS
jgi:hypothetical protein